MMSSKFFGLVFVFAGLLSVRVSAGSTLAYKYQNSDMCYLTGRMRDACDDWKNSKILEKDFDCSQFTFENLRNGVVSRNFSVFNEFKVGVSRYYEAMMKYSDSDMQRNFVSNYKPLTDIMSLYLSILIMQSRWDKLKKAYGAESVSCELPSDACRTTFKDMNEQFGVCMDKIRMNSRNCADFFAPKEAGGKTLVCLKDAPESCASSVMDIPVTWKSKFLGELFLSRSGRDAWLEKCVRFQY